VADATLHVRVVSPEKIVFEGEASALIAPAWDGMVGILPGHAPMLALLGVGLLSLELPGGGGEGYHVAGGVMKIERNMVTILTEYAGDEPLRDIPPGIVVHPEDFGSARWENPLV